MITSHLSITVRYPETNQMGIVSDASYPRWMDMARAAMLKEQGLDFHVLAKLGYLIPVMEIGLIFHQPAYYDDTLHVVTTLRRRPTFRIRLDYEFRRGDLLLASCHSVQGFINQQHRPVRPPPEFMARVDAVFPRIAEAEANPIQNSTAAP